MVCYVILETMTLSIRALIVAFDIDICHRYNLSRVCFYHWHIFVTGMTLSRA